MRLRPFTILATAALTLAVGATAFAQQDFSGALNARKGQFQILALNVGVVGAMARGNAEYDATAAQAAADNILAISSLDQSFHWPAGSDSGAIEGTRALPAIWENNADFLMAWQALGTAATGLQAAAGQGLPALQAAIGPVGGSCGACHDNFRQPQ